MVQLPFTPHIEGVLQKSKDLSVILERNGVDLDILFHSFRSTLLNIEVKKHILAMVFGGQDDQYDFHYYGYNFEVLEHYLKSTGFNDITKVESFGLFQDTSEFKPYGFPISLNIVAK